MRSHLDALATIITISIFAAAAACARRGTSMHDELPTCTTLQDCLAHDGKRVHVVATYRVWDPRPTRFEDQRPAQQVMLRFASSEDGAFLGAWGYPGHQRPLDEIARLHGKTVRVTGTFRRGMPPHPIDPPEAASLDGPCIYPLETLALAE